jgi:hypothetical protein
LSGAARVLERCDRLAQASEEPTALTRRFGTPAMEEAKRLVGGWMREAGLHTREDPLGNLIGRRGDGPVLMLGSHLDTVVDAGRYDGPLGVLVAIEAAERVDRPLEVVGFADEEGVRFGTAYLGSSVMAGRFQLEWLSLRDDEGTRLRDLVREIGPARDEYTTLPERGDRPLFIRLDVDWRYGNPADHVDSLAVRDHLARTFDDFVSESIQHLAHEMGTRLLADHPSIAELRFTAENHTRDPVGEQDGRRVFTDPFPAQGLITLTLTR